MSYKNSNKYTECVCRNTILVVSKA